MFVLLNRPSVEMRIIDKIELPPVIEEMAFEPILNDIYIAVNKVSKYKLPGSSGINAGEKFVALLNILTCHCWKVEKVRQDRIDSISIFLYKPRLNYMWVILMEFRLMQYLQKYLPTFC